MILGSWNVEALTCTVQADTLFHVIVGLDCLLSLNLQQYASGPLDSVGVRIVVLDFPVGLQVTFL